MTSAIGEKPSWSFAEGDEIVPGRHALELLGGGTNYEAYVALDDHLGALVVVKLLRPGLTDDPAARRAIGAEAEMLARLAHPHLLRSFGADLDGDRPHLVLEHLEGFRLSTLVRRFGVILEQLLPLALDMSSVLGYLAREGVVHLDVKPRNIVMGDRPRLIDLSVARRVDELGALTGPVGTDAYMAPEQCDPALFGEIGPASDIWGLGVTLYEALTGSRPFEPGEVRFPQLHQAAPSLQTRAPAPLKDVVMASLEPRPGDRPTADQLADVVQPLADALPPPKIGRFRPRAKALMREVQFR
jgi:serine/threonine protein kinase